MYDSGNDDFVIYHCPLCDNILRSRPISVFLVKAIVEKVSMYLEGTRRKKGESISPSPLGDLWADFFPPSDDEEESKESEEDEDEGEKLYSSTFFREAGSIYRTT